MNERIAKTISALEKNNMKAFYVENRTEACELVRKMLFKGATVASGGSVSLKESGVWDIISSGDYRFFDRTRPGLTEEEKTEIFRATIGCDFYFCSSNAVTENGELINVDGFANRISAISFGPKKVIMLVGTNKLVKDVNEGLLRVKRIAAPKNTARLEIDAPCRKYGHCISLLGGDCPDITDGCSGDTRICCDYLISAKQRIQDRINVIICNEELGY